MQITHGEARRLIEYDSDYALDSEKQKALAAHLHECKACRLHLIEMNDVENILRGVMQKHWNQHPLPLSMDAINIQAKISNPCLLGGCRLRVWQWSHSYF